MNISFRFCFRQLARLLPKNHVWEPVYLLIMYADPVVPLPSSGSRGNLAEHFWPNRRNIFIRRSLESYNVTTILSRAASLSVRTFAMSAFLEVQTIIVSNFTRLNLVVLSKK